MSKKFIIMLIAVLVVIAAGGCTKTCTESDLASFTVILDSPSDGSTVSYSEPYLFDWHYEESCEPNSYYFQLFDPVRGKNTQIFTGDEASDINSDDMLKHYPPTGFMQMYPGSEYQWHVTAVGDDIWNNQSPESQTFTFYTDGLCTPSELDAPVLKSPKDGSWVTTNTFNTKGEPLISIKWRQQENCYAEEFQYQVALDPFFDHVILAGGTDALDTSEYVPMANCTHLYWRVRALVGSTKSDWSEPYSFYYAADSNCVFSQSPGNIAVITGNVFEDKCKGSLPIDSESNNPPHGCVSSVYGIHGDGMWDFVTNNEPGIPDIAVDLGIGPCPASKIDDYYTDENGLYYFFLEAPGEYCVSVSMLENPELQNGFFTSPWPPIDQYVAQRSFVLNPEDFIEQNIGWDEGELKILDFDVQKLTTCRQTDNKNSAAVMYLEEGSVIPVVATNEEKTWFLTTFDCFVSIATGVAEEGDLPLYPEQPIPVVDGQGDPPDPAGNGGDQKPCSSYTGPRSCVYPRCTWVNPIAGPGYCRESD